MEGFNNRFDFKTSKQVNDSCKGTCFYRKKEELLTWCNNQTL